MPKAVSLWRSTSVSQFTMFDGRTAHSPWWWPSRQTRFMARPVCLAWSFKHTIKSSGHWPSSYPRHLAISHHPDPSSPAKIRTLPFSESVVWRSGLCSADHRCTMMWPSNCGFMSRETYRGTFLHPMASHVYLPQCGQSCMCTCRVRSEDLFPWSHSGVTSWLWQKVKLESSSFRYPKLRTVSCDLPSQDEGELAPRDSLKTSKLQIHMLASRYWNQ
jgi:hypothetical protein